MSLIERLNQIYDQDWRMGFLAHTSDTAGEAAREITSLRELVKELREGLKRTRNSYRIAYTEPAPSVEYRYAEIESHEADIDTLIAKAKELGDE